MKDIKRCVTSIYTGYCIHQCSRKRGYGPDGLYCKQHDPIRIAEKEKQKNEQYKRRQKKWAEEDKRKRLIDELCGDIPTEELCNYKLVRKIKNDS